MPKQNNTTAAREQFVPIRTQAAAQAYGWNVHSLAAARFDRHIADTIKAAPRRETLAEIMDGDGPGYPDSAA